MNDNLLQKAKIEAAKNHISLTSFIEEAVEQKLNTGVNRTEAVRDFKIITFGSGGVKDGIDLNNSAGLLAIDSGCTWLTCDIDYERFSGLDCRFL